MANRLIQAGSVANVIGCCLFLCVPQAFAQTQTAPPKAAQPTVGRSGLDEVVVTVRKNEEMLQQVPVAATALTGEQLKEHSVKTITDLQTQAPSLRLQQGADDPQTLLILLRGRQQNDSSLAVDASVGVNVDGFYFPRTLGMAGALLDISRVEVLRGPQGTLYGRNTTGGALSVFTSDPTDELGGSIDVTAGNYNARNVVGIANVPINDHLAARFVVQRGAHDGYGHDENGTDLLSEDSQYYRAKLRTEWGDNWEAVLSGHYEANRSGGAILKLVGLLPAHDDPDVGPLPDGGFITLETALQHGLDPTDPAALADSVAFLQSYIRKAKSDFYDNGGTSHSVSHVRRSDVTLSISGDVSDSVLFRSYTGYQRLHRDELFGAPLPVAFFTGNPITDDDYFSQEFQLVGETHSDLSWVVGAYAGFEKGRDYTGVISLPALSAAFGLPILTVNDNQVRNRSLAGFAQGTWEFIPDWHLTGGLRYSVDTRRVDAVALQDGVCVVPAPGVEAVDPADPTTAECPRTFEKTFKKPSWQVTLDHQLNPDVLLYGKVAEGYRSGGINESGAVLIESFAAFSPETNVEYEAGVKSEFLGHTLRLNLDGYYDKYSDLQVTTAFAAPGGFGTAVSNAATANIYGAEAEADALITPNFSVHVSGAYTHAAYDKFVDATGDRSNEPFTVPKWTYSVSGRYIQPTGIGELALQLDYDWRSKVNYDPTATLVSQVSQSAVGLLNARVNLHIDTGNLDVALFGKNITAEKYYDQVFGGFEAVGANFAYAAAPRTYGIEFVEKFGK